MIISITMTSNKTIPSCRYLEQVEYDIEFPSIKWRHYVVLKKKFLIQWERVWGRVLDQKKCKTSEVSFMSKWH